MNLPIFAESIRELDEILSPLGIDIVDVITNFNPLVLKNIVNSFVGIAAIQVRNNRFDSRYSNIIANARRLNFSSTADRYG